MNATETAPKKSATTECQKGMPKTNAATVPAQTPVNGPGTATKTYRANAFQKLIFALGFFSVSPNAAK